MLKPKHWLRDYTKTLIKGEKNIIHFEVHFSDFHTVYDFPQFNLSVSTTCGKHCSWWTPPDSVHFSIVSILQNTDIECSKNITDIPGTKSIHNKECQGSTPILP